MTTDKTPQKPFRTVKDAVLAINNIPIKEIIQTNARIKGFNLAKLSGMMGMSKSYLSLHFLTLEVNISTLLAASYHLDLNLVEPYMNLLPEQTIGTVREQKLIKEMEELKKQLEDKDRQIEILKEVLGIKK